MTLYKERYLLEDPTQLVTFNLMDKPNLEPIPAYGYRYIFECDGTRFTLKYHIDALEFATAYKKMVKASRKFAQTRDSDYKTNRKYRDKYIKHWQKTYELSHVVLKTERIK